MAVKSYSFATKAWNQTASRLYEIVNVINFSLYCCCDRYRPDTVILIAISYDLCQLFLPFIDGESVEYLITPKKVRQTQAEIQLAG